MHEMVPGSARPRGRSVMVIALAFTLEREPMKLSLLKEGDWAGIITMAIGLQALCYHATLLRQRLQYLSNLSIQLFKLG
jgi:hypothetical protein